MFEEVSFETFKEPKGFLKILQWIFAICAFATTAHFSTTIGFDVLCKDNTTFPVRHICEYPFTLDHELVTVKACNGNSTEFQFNGNEQSNSQFFVTTGVLSFIYSTALIAIYLFADKVYTDNPKAPVVDFFVTLVLAVFWLSSSSAWAHGQSSLVAAADPTSWQAESICKPETGATSCMHFMIGSYGGITISYLFGFICFILWAADLWFLYKETTWFDSIMKNNASPSNAASTSGGI